MGKSKNSSIDLDSLLKKNLTKEEKEVVDDIKNILEDHKRLMEILDLDCDKVRKEFEAYEANTPTDKQYILDEAAQYNEDRLFLEFGIAPSEEKLNDVCELLRFLWEKFESVREEYPWWGEWFNPDNEE